MPVRSAVSSGHPAVTAAALGVLDAGGNAVDAVVAAGFAGAVAEPSLTSLAGGGFLLAAPQGSDPVLLVDGRTLDGRTLVEGDAEGEVLALVEPLSFWGGLDPEDGRIIDAHHPQHRAVVTGRVLVMPSGRGSSSASSVIAEALRLCTGPAAIVLAETDPIIVIGVLVAATLYDTRCPVVLRSGAQRPDRVRVTG